MRKLLQSAALFIMSIVLLTSCSSAGKGEEHGVSAIKSNSGINDKAKI